MKTVLQKLIKFAAISSHLEMYMCVLCLCQCLKLSLVHPHVTVLKVIWGTIWSSIEKPTLSDSIQSY